LVVPGTITNLTVNQGKISILGQVAETKSWQFYQWQPTLLTAPFLPKPRITLKADRLVANLSLGEKNLTIVTADNAAKKGHCQVWRTDLGRPVAPEVETLFPSQLLSIDQHHGLLVHLLQTSDRCQTMFSLFNRRGGVFPAFHLSFFAYQLAFNRYSRNHLFGLAYDTTNTGVLIRLQPLKVNRIGLNLQPRFIEPFPWGYLLADRNGRVALLDYEGFLFGNFEVGEPITAIAPVDRYLCLIATWEGKQGSLLLVDLGDKVESIIKDRQEKR
jgi:serine/threonine-protein kinase